MKAERDLKKVFRWNGKKKTEKHLSWKYLRKEIFLKFLYALEKYQVWLHHAQSLLWKITVIILGSLIKVYFRMVYFLRFLRCTDSWCLKALYSWCHQKLLKSIEIIVCWKHVKFLLPWNLMRSSLFHTMHF